MSTACSNDGCQPTDRGAGSLIFIGLDSWTGLGTFSLAIPGLPHFSQPTLGEFGWAVAIGVTAALVGSGLRWLAQLLQTYVKRWRLLVTPAAGVTIAGLAIAGTAPRPPAQTRSARSAQPWHPCSADHHKMRAHQSLAGRAPKTQMSHPDGSNLRRF